MLRGGVSEQICSKDHANVIEFETLCRIDAANLVQSSWIVCPETLFGNSGSETTGIRLGIPGTRILFDHYIVY